MKKLTSLLLAALMLLSLVACGGTTYKTDVEASAIADAAVVNLTEGTIFKTAEEDILSDYFATPDYVDSSIVRISSDGSSNLDEFGVFRVTAGKQKDMVSLLEGYLSNSYEKNLEWYNSYIPEETPKLRDAEVEVFGNYVVYAIMSADSRALLFSSIEDTLTAK